MIVICTPKLKTHLNDRYITLHALAVSPLVLYSGMPIGLQLAELAPLRVKPSLVREPTSATKHGINSRQTV